MPGIVNRLAATETAAVLADDSTVLADDNAIGVSLDLDRPTDGARGDRVLVLSNRTRQVFDTEACVAWKPSNGLVIGTSLGRSASNACQIVQSASSGCLWALA